MADDVYINQLRINYKQGFWSRGFYWHSDFEAWHVENGINRPESIRSIKTALANDGRDL